MGGLVDQHGAGATQYKSGSIYALKTDVMMTWDAELLAIVQEYAVDDAAFKSELASASTDPTRMCAMTLTSSSPSPPTTAPRDSPSPPARWPPASTAEPSSASSSELSSRPLCSWVASPSGTSRRGASRSSSRWEPPPPPCPPRATRVRKEKNNRSNTHRAACDSRRLDRERERERSMTPHKTPISPPDDRSIGSRNHACDARGDGHLSHKAI